MSVGVNVEILQWAIPFIRDPPMEEQNFLGGGGRVEFSRGGGGWGSWVGEKISRGGGGGSGRIFLEVGVSEISNFRGVGWLKVP